MVDLDADLCLQFLSETSPRRPHRSRNLSISPRCKVYIKRPYPLSTTYLLYPIDNPNPEILPYGLAAQAIQVPAPNNLAVIPESPKIEFHQGRIYLLGTCPPSTLSCSGSSLNGMLDVQFHDTVYPSRCRGPFLDLTRGNGPWRVGRTAGC
ncbi:hypothetical protein FA13DRAFT_1746414 [Coprinellus micaceus]|uniref:Uncharacterized protein n=1 Tax=Coprinellus micaceus TaxID=71717 RepID=A0A4Y7S9Q3_COPMI|nr:hypothetical protein FA13DRAFT_1746414 [Coprinellus micaceus]